MLDEVECLGSSAGLLYIRKFVDRASTDTLDLLAFLGMDLKTPMLECPVFVIINVS